MSGTKQAAHEAFVLDYLKRNVPLGEAREHVRCGLGDAAHLCDAIAADILASGRRRSKQRDALVAIAKQCGDAIWALRERVEVQAAAHPTTPEAE